MAPLGRENHSQDMKDMAPVTSLLNREAKRMSGRERVIEPPAAAPWSGYLDALNRRKWLIAGATIAGALSAYSVCASLRPVYESTATIDLDLKAPSGILGQAAERVDSISDADQIMATQISLLESDSVLRPVADKYDLLKLEDQKLKTPPGSKSPADAPITLKKLKVKRPPNTYLIQVSYRSHDPQLSAAVANAVAGSYIRHTYQLRSQGAANLSSFMQSELEELRLKMEKSSLALAHFESELNVVNPDEKTSILAARLLQLNTQHTDAQADRIRKEAIYNATRAGTLESAQVSPQGDALATLIEKENEARVNLANISQVFGAKHPETRKASAALAELESEIKSAQANIEKRSEIDYQESLSREQMLWKTLLATKADYDQLNARSFEYEQLKHEAEADRQLYEDLVRKTKEASINTGFQNSSVREADAARPEGIPVFPRTGMLVALATLLSTALSTGAVCLLDGVDNKISRPEDLARFSGARVLGTLPRVKPWKGRELQFLLPAGDEADGAGVPAVTGRAEEMRHYRESIRSIRTPILLDQSNRRVRILLLTSAMPGEGKSTAAAHLALSYSAQGKKVLLIDADLRRPSLHRIFDLNNGTGLTNVLLRETEWRQARLRVPGDAELDVIPAGPASRRACDLMEQMNPVLEAAAREYELVIVDSPPVLGFAEALELAPSVDGVVLITRAGDTNRQAVDETLLRLGDVRANVVGAILNGYSPLPAGKYYKHYQAARNVNVAATSAV